MKHFLFSFLLFFSLISLHAQKDYSSITKERTQTIIDSITHSNNRTTKFWYEPENVLYSKSVWLPNFELSYLQCFSNGKLLQEGLLVGTDDYDQHVGTWKYYDENGNLFKEYDFSKKERTLYGMQHEKYDWVMDSIPKAASKFLIGAFGKKYFDEHIRIDTSLHWDQGGYSYQYNTGTYPSMPRKRPVTISVSCSIIYNDTLEVSNLYMDIDSNFRVTEIWDIDSLKYFHPGYLKIDYNAAHAIAVRKGFKDGLSLSWDNSKQRYYWESRKEISSTEDGNSSEEVYDLLRINAMTGASLLLKGNRNETIADGFFSNYTKPILDTFVVPQGWKKMDEGGISFAIPEDWYTIIIYGSAKSGIIFTNGNDSLFYSEEGAYMMSNYFEEELDVINAKAFAKNFPDQKINGRPFEMYIKKNKDGTSDILFWIYESGVGMTSNVITYCFSAKHVTMQQRDLIFDILKTIRFSYSD